MTRILIAEDEPRIASFLEKGLRANGFTATVAGDGHQALTRARTGEFDLIILDLGLPGRDGSEVLAELRGSGVRIPVIILTARTGVADTVAGLEGGADDYLTKPFAFEELLARVRVRLRGDAAVEQTVLRCGGVSLDLRTRRAQQNDREVELTAREFALLETLLRHPGQVLSREQLLSHVWGCVRRSGPARTGGGRDTRGGPHRRVSHCSHWAGGRRDLECCGTGPGTGAVGDAHRARDHRHRPRPADLDRRRRRGLRPRRDVQPDA